MTIRPPRDEDWPEIYSMARAMHAESWFAGFDFDEEKVRELVGRSIDDPDFFALVAIEADHIVGFFCAVASEHFFGHDRYACDLAMYVHPAARGGPTALRFIKRYEAWCRWKGVREIHLGTSTGVMSERTLALYRRLGYHSPATALRKQVLADQPAT